MIRYSHTWRRKHYRKSWLEQLRDNYIALVVELSKTLSFLAIVTLVGVGVYILAIFTR